VLVFRVDSRGRLVSSRVRRGSLPRVKLSRRRACGARAGNLLVKGDCLLALAALRRRLAGKLQLVYADPPYNTGRGGRQYDDALDRNLWLAMLRDRLAACVELLRPTGWLFLHLDATRLAEAKALLDRQLGEESFAHLITWQRTPDAMTFLGQGTADLVTSTEFLLVYAKDPAQARLNRLQREVEATDKVLVQYDLEVQAGKRRKIEEEQGPGGEPVRIYEYVDFELRRVPRGERLSCFDRLHQSTRIHPDSSFQHRLAERLDPGGLHAVSYVPARGKRAGQRIEILLHGGRQLWPATANARLREGQIYRLADLSTLWSNEEISAVGTAPEGGVSLRRGKKPEALLERVIRLATARGDLVLDPFAGSGTTAAVAHKLRRRWITCEISKHAEKLVLPRLTRVVSGDDQSGISQDVGWKGGGGFRFVEVDELR
jgi:adenine-specific DNA-methyltransferase